MNKEKISTILLGIFVGLLLTGAIVLFLKIYNNKSGQKTARPASVILPSPTNTPPAIKELVIFSPAEGATVSAKTVKIEGKTKPEEIVILLNQQEEKIISANKDGSFNTNMNLEEGENNIYLYSNGLTETRNIIYIPENNL